MILRGSGDGSHAVWIRILAWRPVARAVGPAAFKPAGIGDEGLESHRGVGFDE